MLDLDKRLNRLILFMGLFVLAILFGVYLWSLDYPSSAMYWINRDPESFVRGALAGPAGLWGLLLAILLSGSFPGLRGFGPGDGVLNLAFVLVWSSYLGMAFWGIFTRKKWLFNLLFVVLAFLIGSNALISLAFRGLH